MSAVQRPRSSPQPAIRDSNIIALPSRTAQPEGYWLALIGSTSSLDKVMSLIDNLSDGSSLVLLTSIHDYDHALDVVRAVVVDDALTAPPVAAPTIFRGQELEPAPESSRPARVVKNDPGKRCPLTPREVEVLRLIVAGRSNREIAKALIISVATVERHVSNIYTKIGARNRADATAYAFHNQLLDA